MFALDLTKILAIAGYNDGNRLSDVELINLSNDTCLPIPDFPVDNEEMFAFDRNGTAMVCGGFGSTGTYDKCWNLDEDQTWQEFATMGSQRKRSDGVVWDDGSIWVVGGRDASSILSTTELYNGAMFEPSDSLPEPLEFHCVVKTSQETALIIGGYNLAETHSRKTWEYNRNTGLFTELDSMVDGRYGHICEIVESPFNGTEIVVAGGGTDRQSVDIYSFSTNSWRAGPRLPQATSWASSVPYGNSFLMIGGGDGSGASYNDVFEYDIDNVSGGWIHRSDLSLTTARYDLGAVLLDTKLLNCTAPATPLFF